MGKLLRTLKNILKNVPSYVFFKIFIAPWKNQGICLRKKMC